MVAKIQTGTMKKFKPNGNRVLVKLDEALDKTLGGIVLPDAAKEKPQVARVIALGDGRLLDNGTRVPIKVTVGQVVILARYSGTEVKLDGVDHMIVDADEILGSLEES